MLQTIGIRASDQARKPCGSRRFAAVGLASLLALLGACGDGTEPEPPLVYALAQVAGQALPAPMDAARWPDGTDRDIEALEGRLTLFSDGSFEYGTHAQRTVDGVPYEDLGWKWLSGAYERTDSTVIAHFDGVRDVVGRPWDYTVTYHVSDSGRVLTGTQGFGRVYVWVLVEAEESP